MNLKCKIKASSVTNLTDARFFLAAGVNWLGFNFDIMDDNCISIDKVKEIKGWLFEPNIIGEFGNHQDKSEILAVTTDLELDGIELFIDHPNTNDIFPVPVFIKINFNRDGDLNWLRRNVKKLRKNVELFILNIQYDELQNEETEKLISKIFDKTKLLIQTNLNKDNCNTILKDYDIDGFNLQTQKEEKPGISMVDEYDDIISALKSES